MFLTSACLLQGRDARQETSYLLANERYPWPTAKGPGSNSIRVRAPVHGTGDHLTITHHPFNNTDMAEPRSALHPPLQDNDRTNSWRT